MFYNLDYRVPKWNVFIDWFNVSIQYVDIEYVLHNVKQHFNVYSMLNIPTFNMYTFKV